MEDRFFSERRSGGTAGKSLRINNRLNRRCLPRLVRGWLASPKDTDMKWKLERIDWHSKGLCWSWLKIRKSVYYSGNQVQWSWGRLAFVFERRNWIHSANA